MPLTTPVAADGIVSSRAARLGARARSGPILVIVLSAVVLVLNVARLIGDSALVDASVYFGGARLLLEGGDLYGTRIAAPGIELPFTYPPFAALLFVGVFAGSLLSGAYLLTVLGTGALLSTLFLIARRYDQSRPAALASAAAFTAAATFLEPVAETLDFVQINTVLLGMVAWDCLGRAGLLPRGLLVGLATAIKLTPAVFVLFFLARRDWRSVGWTAIGFLGASGAGWLVAPAQSVDYWSTVLADSGRIGDPAYVGNQSLRGLFSRLVGDETVVSALWVLTSVLVVTTGWLVAARLRGLGQDVPALCAVATVGLLVSPVSWSHHWVWVVPALLVLWSRPAGMPHEVSARPRSSIPAPRSVRSDRPAAPPAALTVRPAVPRPSPWSGPVLRRRGLCLLVAGYLIAGVHWWLPHERDDHLGWSGWQQVLGSDYVLAALLGLGALAVLAWRWGRPLVDPSQPQAEPTSRAPAAEQAPAGEQQAMPGPAERGTAAQAAVIHEDVVADAAPAGVTASAGRGGPGRPATDSPAGRARPGGPDQNDHGVAESPPDPATPGAEPGRPVAASEPPARPATRRATPGRPPEA